MSTSYTHFHHSLYTYTPLFRQVVCRHIQVHYLLSPRLFFQDSFTLKDGDGAHSWGCSGVGISAFLLYKALSPVHSFYPHCGANHMRYIHAYVSRIDVQTSPRHGHVLYREEVYIHIVCALSSPLSFHLPYGITLCDPHVRWWEGDWLGDWVANSLNLTRLIHN